MEIDPNALCRDLTVAQQVVEIAKALKDARIIVMDEPTAALTPREVDGLLQVVSELRTQGIGIIYISHRLMKSMPSPPRHRAARRQPRGDP